jgi:mono/diheme cytochrome c family protein
MKSICSIAVLAILVAIPMSLWSAVNGAELYKDNCSACHGDKGEGKSGMPTLAGAKGTKKTAAEIVTFLMKGESGKTMHASPVPGSFNEEQAKAVADYVKSLK